MSDTNASEYKPLKEVILDSVEEKLPQTVGDALHSAREFPHKLIESIENAITTEEPKESLKSAAQNIRSDAQLVKSMNSLSETAKEYKKKFKENKPLRSPKTNFFYDEEQLYMGPPFTLTPPYVTP